MTSSTVTSHRDALVDRHDPDRGSRVAARRAGRARRTGPSSSRSARLRPAAPTTPYGEGLARLLTRKLGLPVACARDRRPGRKPQADRIRRDRACVRHARHRAAGMERQRRLDRRKAIPQRTGSVSDVRHAVPVHRAGRLPRSARSRISSGKRVGIGPQGGTGGIYTPLLFKALKTDASFSTGAGPTSQRSSARASSTRWSSLAACRFPRSPTSRRRRHSATFR